MTSSLRLLVVVGCAAGASFAGASRLRADDPSPAPVPQPSPDAKPARDGEAALLAWVADLGSDDFRTREAASKHLAEAGETAREALEAVVKTSDSLEVRWRAGQLLGRLNGRQATPLGQPPKTQEPDGVPGESDIDRLRRQMQALGHQDPAEFMRRWMEELRKARKQTGLAA